MAKRKPETAPKSRAEAQIEAQVRRIHPGPAIEPGDAAAVAALRVLGEYFPAVLLVVEQRSEAGAMGTAVFLDPTQLTPGHAQGMLEAAHGQIEGQDEASA